MKKLQSGSHVKHIQSNVDCSRCHNRTVLNSRQIRKPSYHVNKLVDIAFDAQSDPGTNATYNGLSTPLSEAPGNGYGGCSALYCHGSTLTAGTNTSPDWGGAAECGTCHGKDASNPPTAGSHSRHANNTSQGGYGFACTKCHPEVTDGTHVNFQVGWQLENGSYRGLQTGETVSSAPSTQYQTCSSTYCHSNGTSVATGTISSNTSSVWGTQGSLACNSCHGNTAFTDWRKPMPYYTEDNPKSNSHMMHASFMCNYCHVATTTDGTTVTNREKHVNGVYDVVPDQTRTYTYGTTTNVNFTYAFDVGGGTCNSISCHAMSNQLPTKYTWGGTAFTASMGIGYFGGGCYEVQFSASTTGYGTLPYTYNWEFGDGQTSTEQNPDHFYPSSGPYDARLTVRDANRNLSIATATGITPHQQTNQPPVPDRTVSVLGYTVTVIDRSTDPDPTACGHSGPGTVTVNWGNSTADSASVDLSESPSNFVFTKTYSLAGGYTIRHSVKDNAEATVSYPTNTVVTVPTRYSASGRITKSGAGLSGVSIDLYDQFGAFYKTVATNSSGDWLVSQSSGLIGGVCYSVIPAYSGHVFNPASRTICAEAAGIDFIASAGTPTAPNAPALLPEQDIEISEPSTNIQLEWNAVTVPDGDQTQYVAEIDTSTAFNTANYQVSSWSTGTSWTFSLPTGTWYWHVKARDGLIPHQAIQSDWSAPDQFIIVRFVPDTPTLQAEPDIVVAGGNTEVQLVWNSTFVPDGHAPEYMVEVDSSSGFNTGNYRATPSWLTDTNWIVSLPTGTWYWQVKGRDAGIGHSIYETAWSGIDDFKIKPPDAPQIAAEPDV